MTARRIVPAISIFLSLHIGISTFYYHAGRLFLDSGFYLNATRSVLEGKIPYRDFFFVQGPVYPYLYALLLMPFGVSVLSSSVVSIVFGGLALLLAILLAHRLGGPFAAIATGIALTLAPIHIYSFASIKLYALAGFFFTLAMYLLSFQTSTTCLALGSIAAVLAAGTRLTLLPGSAFLVLVAGILGYRNRPGFRTTAVVFGAALLSALCLSGPFLAIDSDALIYNLIGIHTSASDGPFVFGWVNKIKVLAQIAIEYSPLAVLPVMVLLSRRTRPLQKDFPIYESGMFGAILLVTIAHLTANWFSTDYQTIVMPGLAAVLAGWAGSRLNGVKPLLILLVFGLISFGLRAGHPIWRGPGAARENLATISAFLRTRCQPSDGVAACSAVFAIEAGLRNVDPFGGAPFTFTPHWTDEECRRFKGINTAGLIKMMSDREAACLVFEDDSFSVGFPGFFRVAETEQRDIRAAIDQNYMKIGTFPDLGNGAPELHVYRRRVEP